MTLAPGMSMSSRSCRPLRESPQRLLSFACPARYWRAICQRLQYGPRLRVADQFEDLHGTYIPDRRGRLQPIQQLLQATTHFKRQISLQRLRQDRLEVPPKLCQVFERCLACLEFIAVQFGDPAASLLFVGRFMQMQAGFQ